MHVIVSAYNVLQNNDVTSRVFMRKVTPHSLFQYSVETLNGGFDIWIARYSKTNVIFLRNFYIDCATNSLPLSVYKYRGTRPSLLASMHWKAIIMQLLVLSCNVLPRCIYLVYR